MEEMAVETNIPETEPLTVLSTEVPFPSSNDMSEVKQALSEVKELILEESTETETSVTVNYAVQQQVSNTCMLVIAVGVFAIFGLLLARLIFRKL